MRSALSLIALALLFSQGTNANLLNSLFSQESTMEVEAPASLEAAAAKPPTTPVVAGPMYLRPLTGPYDQTATWGLVTVGSNQVPLSVTIDHESPTTMFVWTNASSFNNLTTQYAPPMSSSASSLDPLRYRDGSTQCVGSYVVDTVCAQTTTNLSSTNYTKTCWRQEFLGIQTLAEKIAPWQGTIGLGIGQPRYGSSFLDNLNKFTNKSLAQNWTYITGPFYTNQTMILIGGPANQYLIPGNSSGLGLHAYPVASGYTNWTIALKDIKYGNTSIYNANETATAHFGIYQDLMLLPNNTYNRVFNFLKNVTSNLTCDVNTGACYVKDICSTVSAKLSSLSLRFSDNWVYEIPVQTLAVDGDNLYCYIKIGRQVRTRQNFIDIGAPFFKSFQTTFDTVNKTVYIGEVYGPGNVTSI